MTDFIFKIIEIIFNFFRKKMKGVTLDIWIVNHVIHIKNTSHETAYNFNVKPSGDLFWTFYHSTEFFTPNREIRIQFSRITANKWSGTLYME